MNKRTAAILIVLLLLVTACANKENMVSEPPPQPPQVEEELPPQEVQEEEIKEPELPGALLVMVDNFKNARPQSGLDKADMVYEMLAESGITRYMAVFYHRHAERIGPVRSARYYFVQLAKGYDAPLAHAGGSTDSLNMIVSLKIKDMDEIYNAGSYFWRDKKKKMPHNLYTSTERLLQGSGDKGYDFAPLSPLPTATEWEGEPQPEFTVDYSVSNYAYKASWVFTGEKYERKINGEPHVMEDGKAITADNVVVITAPTKDVVKDGILYSEIDIIGRGDARYFIDGKAMKGFWLKEAAKDSLRLLDEAGEPMKFKQGQTWIQVVPSFKSLIIN